MNNSPLSGSDTAEVVQKTFEDELRDRADGAARYSVDTMTSYVAFEWPVETTIGDLIALQVELEVAVSRVALDAALKTLAEVRSRARLTQAQESSLQDRSISGRAE